MSVSTIGITGQAGSGKDTLADLLCDKYEFTKISLADPIKRFGFHVFEFDKVQLWGPSSARNAFDPRYAECEILSQGIKFAPGCSMSAVSRACDKAWGGAAKRLLSYGPQWLESVLPEADVEEQMESLCHWFSGLGHKYSDLSPRIMLQHLGTEWGREEAGADTWVNVFLRTADAVKAGHPYSREEGLSEAAGAPSQGVVCSDVRFSNEMQCIRRAGGKIIKIVRPDTDGVATKLGIEGHASEREQKGFTMQDFDAIINNNDSLSELKSALDITLKGLGL
jgi:ABC-type dipeptide/oligopeptide/nickel transport system ATPase subunit